MNQRAELFLSIVCGVGAFVLAIIAWVQTKHLSLPCPVSLPILNAFLPPIVLLGRWSAFQTRNGSRKRIAGALWMIQNVATYPALVLLILSLVFAIPSNLFACSAESKWAHMFQHKDESSIRAIQDSLRCCGFNSLYDRAWPFPSREVDASACQQIQGYSIRCSDPWMRQESTVAGLTAIASFLNWLLVIISLHTKASHDQVRARQFDTERQRLLPEQEESIRSTSSAANECRDEERWM